MLSKKIQDALNDQIQMEFQAAYLYLSMSAHCEANNLPGFAHWMRMQYEEETGHAMKVFDFINDRGGRVALKSIEQPAQEFGTAREVFESTLTHERKVTAKIGELMNLALAENDHATRVFLQWFVTEQVEEEKTAGDILEQIKMAGNDSTALLMLDKELGARVPV